MIPNSIWFPLQYMSIYLTSWCGRILFQFYKWNVWPTLFKENKFWDFNSPTNNDDKIWGRMVMMMMMMMMIMFIMMMRRQKVGFFII